MNDVGRSQDEAFASDVAAWLAENFPPSLAYRNPHPYINDAEVAASDRDFQTWLKRMVDKGWGAPTWPVEYGGGGLTRAQDKILTREMARIGAFNPNRSYGQMMLGPTLLEYASEEQKARFLPPIARGEVRWCQGFSEPGAGSDLASLQTRCVDDGGTWVVNGQKIWTSNAHQADWCFCLVRTDTSRKQGGISFLLIDMRSRGVEVRPIVLISGTRHFCEVFLTDVRVPRTNMVGEINRGWEIAKHLLQHERDSLAGNRTELPGLAGMARARLGVDECGRIDDPWLRQRLIANAMRTEAYSQTFRRVAEESAGGGVSTAVSVLKNLGASVSQARAELVADLLGNQGLGWEGEGFSEEEIEATRAWLHSRAYSIYGGSHEVQNNIIAKRVLGLPDMAGR
ncbi:acyl-CoA dehydrogenase family protein [Luteimonas saliphila]|uniref:acyl-CoA dehydrogenase family protein n=1 Tax=Luteimonas saliphila TaxID=2804919 RepID=UPI00192DE1A4|nr:acyl-CoA dehydrogenase family protein [Luteimonas saliphila]